MVKLGLLLGGENTPLRDVIDLGRGAEAAGFDSVWCPEFWRGAYVPLSAIAQVTSRVRLAPAVAMAFARSPFLQARNALDLDELSNGRFIMALGTGTLRMDLGWPAKELPSPVPGMREYVDIVRRLWDAWSRQPGQPVEYRGRYYTISTAEYIAGFSPLRADIPVHIAGVLPRMLRLAGEVAEGVVGYPLASRRYLRDDLWPHVVEGARSAGRDPASVEIVTLAVCAVDRDREAARRLARRQLAFYATSTAYRPLVERDGFGKEWEVIQEASLRDDTEGVELGVTDEMLDAYTVAGTPEECRRRVEELEGLADVVVLHGPTYELPTEEIVRNYWRILEAFAR